MRLKSSGSDHLAHSFTDLMTSLMVIFVLLLLAFLNRQASTNTAVARSVAQDLQQQLEKAGFQDSKILPNDPYTVVFQAPRALTFARNQSRLKPEGEKFLQQEIPNLASILCDDKYRESVESVNVEGYADESQNRKLSEDVTRNLNLKLSQERSREVVRRSLTSLQDGRERSCLADKISASGTSATERNPAMTFKVRLNSLAAAEALSRLTKAPAVPEPANQGTTGPQIVALLDKVQNAIGQFEFQVSEDEVNQYLAYALVRNPRLGVNSATVKLFAHNYVSVYAILDFDAMERERPGTIPMVLRPILRGKQPILLDFRFYIQDGKATYSIEKAYYRETELPVGAVRQLIRVMGAQQPEHFQTDEPVPLPFGLRDLETRDHLLVGHK